jgi:hypothetical protein
MGDSLANFWGIWEWFFGDFRAGFTPDAPYGAGHSSVCLCLIRRYGEFAMYLNDRFARRKFLSVKCIIRN